MDHQLKNRIASMKKEGKLIKHTPKISDDPRDNFQELAILSKQIESALSSNEFELIGDYKYFVIKQPSQNVLTIFLIAMILSVPTLLAI